MGAKKYPKSPDKALTWGFSYSHQASSGDFRPIVGHFAPKVDWYKCAARPGTPCPDR